MQSASCVPADPRAERVRSVLVVGGGSAGWMAATALATALPRGTEVRLVESEAIGTVGVGEATIPPIKQFNRTIGLDERAFMQATQATFKFGIEFRGWGAPGDRYLHQFGRVGREIDTQVRLHHWWLLGKRAGGANYPAWEDMFVAKAAARANRFALPDKNPRAPLGRYTYAYQFDAHLYAKYLRSIAEVRGVVRLEGRVDGVERSSGGDDIAAVRLDDGRRLEADLFVDCSGFRSLLLGGELGEPFESWSRWIPSDRALAVPSRRAAGPLTPYTRGTAHAVGWQWRIPLQHRTGNGHVFASAFSSEGEAEERLMKNLDGKPLDAPRLIRFETGMRRRHWVGNVVAIGLAAGFLEPIESTSIHLVQTSLERLVELFPTRRMDPLLRDRFNAQTAQEWARVRDFIIAHYHLCRRDDSEFWRAMQAMTIPDSLTEVLELWRASGVLPIDGGHLFQVGSWSSVLIGQHFEPEAVHPLTAGADPAVIADAIRRIAAEVEAAAQALPPHEQFVERYCPAELPATG
jgi:tryptophan halogenase